MRPRPPRQAPPCSCSAPGRADGLRVRPLQAIGYGFIGGRIGSQDAFQFLDGLHDYGFPVGIRTRALGRLRLVRQCIQSRLGQRRGGLMLPAVRRFVPHDVVFRPAFRHLEAKPFHLGIPNRERLAGRLRVPHNALGQHVLSLPRDPLFRKLSHQQRVAAITHLPGSSEGTRRATKAAFVGAKATSRRSSSGTCGSSGST